MEIVKLAPSPSWAPDEQTHAKELCKELKEREREIKNHRVC